MKVHRDIVAQPWDPDFEEFSIGVISTHYSAFFYCKVGSWLFPSFSQRLQTTPISTPTWRYPEWAYAAEPHRDYEWGWYLKLL